MRFKVPSAPAKPIVVDAERGAIVKVLVPEILAPRLIASVVIDSALPSMRILPLAPVTTEPAVMAVVLKIFVPPTAPLIVTVPEPAFTVKVLAVLVALLTVESKITSALLAVSVVLVPMVKAPLYVCEPEVVIALVLIVVAPLMERFFAVPVRTTVSESALPNTALPVILSPWAPETVPLKVAVLTVRVALFPRETLFA